MSRARWFTAAGLFATGLLIAIQAATAAAPGPMYLSVTSFAAGSQNGETAKLSLTTKADVPRQPDGFISANNNTGFAWVDVDTGYAFSVVIHGSAPRNSHQDPEGWHAHVVTLTGGATAPNDFCLASLDADPTAGILLHGNTMNVNVTKSRLPVAPEAFDVAVGFTVQLDFGCPAFVNLGQPAPLHLAIRINA
jgi:hypothetical protein